MTAAERDAALRGVGHYRAWCESQDKPYVAHALTWLNQERWEQWQTPAAPGGNGHHPVRAVSEFTESGAVRP